MKQVIKSQIIIVNIIFIIIAALCGFAVQYNPGWWNFIFLDLQFLLSQNSYTPGFISKDIAIILIDSQSMNHLQLPGSGSSWRRYHGTVIDMLIRCGAHTIVFDIEFVTPDKNEDPHFAEILNSAGNVIAAESGDVKIVEPIAHNLYNIGHPGIETFWAVPRKIHQYPQAKSRRALSFETAFSYFRNQPVPDQTRLHELASLQQFWINYKHPPHFFPVFSYKEILESSGGRLNDTKKTPLSIFKDRIVLIDYVNAEFPTPNLTGKKLPGVYAHGYAIHNLLHNDSLKPAPIYSSIILILSLLIVQGFLLLRQRVLKILSLCLFFILLFIIEYKLIIAFNLWLLYSPVIVSLCLLIIINRIYKRMVFNTEFKDLTLRFNDLKNLVQNIKHVEKKKHEFTAILVHDIKNHAAAIDTSLLLLYKKYSQHTGLKKNLDFVKISCTDILTLSANLMEIEKMEDGEIKVNRAQCDKVFLNAMFHKYSQHPGFTLQHIHMEIVPIPDDFFIQADHYLLERVIQNLFNNAARYTSKNGRVVVSCYATNREKIISLYNTAPPIPENKHTFIFEKYNRISHKASPYSRGLGLYFCKQVMEAHKGHIWVEIEKQGNFFNLGFCNEHYTDNFLNCQYFQS